MHHLRRLSGAAASGALVLALAAGCSSVEGVEAEASPVAQALSGDVSCDPESQPAYSGGQRLGDVQVMRIDGKRVTIGTGHAFLKLRSLAEARGIDIRLNSGFRTMAEQQHFYDCYRNQSCNNGNLAARPGYSNHQSGRALDIGTSQRAALNQLIEREGLDWRRTVPSEAWHYEYFGPAVSGPCAAGGQTAPTPPGRDPGTAAPAPSPPPSGPVVVTPGPSPAPNDEEPEPAQPGQDQPPARGCRSPTLGREVEPLTCVQAPSDRRYYQCMGGYWYPVNGTTGPWGPCSSVHTLP